MSGRGTRCRSFSCASTYTCSSPMAAAETSLNMPVTGSRWKVPSMSSRISSRWPGATPSKAAMTVAGTRAPKSAT